MEMTKATPFRTDEFIQDETQIHTAPSAIFVPNSVETIYSEAIEVLKYNPDKTDASNGEEPLLSFEENSAVHDLRSVGKATRHLKLHEVLKTLGLERIANRDAWLSSDLINKILMERATSTQRRIIKHETGISVLMTLITVACVIFCIASCIPASSLHLAWRVVGIVAGILSMVACMIAINKFEGRDGKYFSKYDHLKLEDVKERIIPVNMLLKMLSLKKEIPEIEFTLDVPTNSLLSFNEKREYTRYRLNIGSENYYFKES